MIQIDAARNASERLVLQLIRAMETGDLPETVKEICSANFVWANSGLPTINGLDELFEQMSKGGFASQIPILGTMTHFSAELLHMASTLGDEVDVVFTERVDHHWDESGRDLMTPHICGVAEVRGGKICAFRDFYDVACYEQSPTNIQSGFELGLFREAQQRGER